MVFVPLGFLFALATTVYAVDSGIPQWRQDKAKLLPNFMDDEGALPCRASGFCSVGRVKQWTGDVYPLQGLRDCLHARSYRRELILVAETRLSAGFQTYWNALSAGYGHVVLMTSDEQCVRAAQYWPELSCIWSSQVFANKPKYLLDRHAFLPRAARLGYNVLMLDSDVIFLSDVYAHLKAPPLRDAQLITLRDPGIGWLNSAIIYTQGARPDGPAVYVLAEVIDRLERWAEDAEALRQRGLPDRCWEQMTMSDALLSAVIGRPVVYGCWDNVHNESYRISWEGAHKRLFGYPEDGHGLGVWHYMEDRSWPWPASLAARAPGFPPDQRSPLWMQSLQVPNTQGRWPEELGGVLFAPTRGPKSREWVELLKSDGWPLWPDPEDASQASAASATTETFAFLPDWLGTSFHQTGTSGWWHPGLLGPNATSPFALAHFYHTPGGAHNKLTVKMANAAWSWDLQHRLHPHGGVFFASTAHAPVPDVLAYTPDVETREWASYEEWDAATKALTRLAMEMGRAAAFPAPRCNVSWLGGEASNRLPLQLPPQQKQWCIPTVRSAADSPAAESGFPGLRCMLGGYLMQGCLAVRWYFSGGMLAPEFDHFMAHVIRGRGGEQVATVPAETLTQLPPGGAGSGSGSGSAWHVEALAAALMAAHGGPGSGLAHPRLLEQGGRAAEVARTAAAGAGSRPRLLLLPGVPALSEQLGPREALYREHEHEDFNKMSCPWIQGKEFS